MGSKKETKLRVLAPVGFHSPRLRFEHFMSPARETWNLASRECVWFMPSWRG